MPLLRSMSVFLSKTLLNLLFAAVLTPALFQDKAASETIKILGRDVPVEFPAGWDEIKTHWGQNRPKDGATVYPVRVIVLQNSSALSRSPVGVVRHDWATIDEEELDTVLKSLALLKVSIESATSGAFNVRLDVTLDDDVYADYRGMTSESKSSDPVRLSATAAMNSRSFGSDLRWVAEQVAPRINDEKFDTDDGSYNGPFPAVFVIHPRLPVQDRVWTVDHTPVATLSYYKFSQFSAKTSLPTALFDAWKTMVWPGALESAPVFGEAGSSPRVAPGALWKALAQRSVRSQRSTAAARVELSKLDTIAQVSLPSIDVENVGGQAVVASPASADRTLVSSNLVGLLADKMPNLGVTRFALGGRQRFVEVDAPIAEIRAALAVGSPQTPAKTAWIQGEVVGDFEAKAGTGPDGKPSMEATFTHNEPRGSVVVAAGEPLVPAQATGVLQFDAKLSTDENVVLDFYGSNGVVLSCVLGGDMATQVEDPSGKAPLDLSVPSDDQWHPVTLPVTAFSGKEVLAVVLHGGQDRLSRGAATVSLTVPKLAAEAGPGTSSALNPALGLTKTSSPPTADQAQALLEAINSSNLTVRLTALDVLARVKMPESVLAISTVSRSGFAPVAAMAMRALAFQDTPDAWAVIREAVERGPFDHNRRFAARELAVKPDPAMAASLNFLAARSWLARLESVRALSAIKTTSAEIIMAALLQSEPSPCVRLEIVKTADITVELVSRRMLYTAVNDSSQWVRAVALGRLLDSSNKSVRSEALNGVKDEAVGVRLYLLGLMATRANADDRSALRLAVTDLDSRVRAAALRSFARQPGPVDPNEVKNTFTDTDPEVRAALADLAKAKNFKVPS